MANMILGFILILFIMYGPLPTLFARWFQWNAIRTVKEDRSVCLTFDDGPDPNYTPQILSVLREHNVKATFFLVAERAARYPELTRAILEEGHEIGSHGSKHLPLWFVGWKRTRSDITSSFDRLAEITGKRPVWYRSPWGLLNLAAVTANPLREKPLVLWSVMPADWSSKTSASTIVSFAKRKLKNGSIIVLHDSDLSFGAASGAPLHTLMALPILISHAKQQGYTFRTASEVLTVKTGFPKLKQAFQAVWMVWERIFEWGSKKRSVYVSDWGIFKVFVTKHHGKSIVCEDGEKIEAGDWVGELHLDNHQILKMARELGADRSALLIARMIKESLGKLSAAIETTPELARMKALVGITLLNRGVKGLGFEIHGLPSSWFKKLSTVYLRLLMRVVHPKGNKRIKGNTQKLVPMMLVMTRDSLMKRYSLNDKKGGTA